MMRQTETISAPLNIYPGEGAVVINECSNNSAKEPCPRLTIMIPAWEEVKNEGHSDAIVVHHAAKSLELYKLPVRQLYEFLKMYYEKVGAQ